MSLVRGHTTLPVLSYGEGTLNGLMESGATLAEEPKAIKGVHGNSRNHREFLYRQAAGFLSEQSSI